MEYLRRQGLDATPLTGATGGRDPYYQCGCHPDVVERLWDQLGKSLPADCRRRVHGVPALVHPVTGAIFGLGLGTQYGLRLPGALLEVALAAGAKRRSFGGADQRGAGDRKSGLEGVEDWVVGSYAAAELDWCRRAFEVLG